MNLLLMIVLKAQYGVLHKSSPKRKAEFLSRLDFVTRQEVDMILQIGSQFSGEMPIPATFRIRHSSILVYLRDPFHFHFFSAGCPI